MKLIFKEIYAFEQKLKECSSLTINEAIALCSLNESDYKSGMLAREMGLSPGRMSKILSQLEERLLVIRSLDKDDKRIMRFSISPQGETLLLELKSLNLEIPNFQINEFSQNSI